VISQHDEIEAKMSADGVDVAAFKAYMNKEFDVVRYEFVQGPDRYYESGPNVVRHRIKHNVKGHELTVKRRKSTGSTRDRQEIDLHFSKKTFCQRPASSRSSRSGRRRTSSGCS
jgi:hypothetical protein